MLFNSHLQQLVLHLLLVFFVKSRVTFFFGDTFCHPAHIAVFHFFHEVKYFMQTLPNSPHPTGTAFMITTVHPMNKQALGPLCSL